jgi:hypothetical protein
MGNQRTPSSARSELELERRDGRSEARPARVYQRTRADRILSVPRRGTQGEQAATRESVQARATSREPAMETEGGGSYAQLWRGAVDGTAR